MKQEIAGQTFGRWTVLREVDRETRSHRTVDCRCQCGTRKLVDLNTLKAGTSTGCLQCRKTGTHGKCGTQEYSLWHNAKIRARRTRRTFLLKIEDIVIPEVCPLLGIPIQRSLRKRYHANNPSLDRLRSDKGYTPDNVWVISWRANAIKHNATLAELETLSLNLRAEMARRSS